MKNGTAFVLILLITILAGIISFPKQIPINFSILGKEINLTLSSPEIHIGNFNRDLKIVRGLDIQGGTQLILETVMDNVATENRKDALTSVREVIARRIDLYGVAEANIQTSEINNNYRIIVELPGVDNVDTAISLIGQTASLDFAELPDNLKDSTQAAIWDFQPTGLTGADLKKATVSFGGQNNISGEPGVSLLFTEEGTKKFAEITRRNVGYPVAIFLDGIPVTTPRVNEEILTGEAVISGNFTTESAKELAIQLNAGALPVPVNIVEQRTIGPSLGEESIAKSLTAGIIGLALVCAFMIVLYGRLGIIADIGLVIYGLITLAIYKLIPVTLTLPGIAGLILTIGMAVDSNILIFERIKEERRSGRVFGAAIEMGFGRAWDSIKDANMATILTALVLLNPFNFSWLVSSGSVKGFALTLLLGVFISMFTGIFISRVLIRTFYKERVKKEIPR